MKKEILLVFLMIILSSTTLLSQNTSWVGTHFVFSQPNKSFVHINIKICSEEALDGYIGYENHLIPIITNGNDCASENISRISFDSLIFLGNKNIKAINVVTNKPSTCYVTIFNTAEDEGFNVLPVTSLATNYQDNYLSTNTIHDSLFYKHVISIEDSTILEITLLDNLPYIDTIQKNDVLIFRSPKVDITSNKPIALFTSLKTNVEGSNCGFLCCSEEMYEQVLPINFAAENYIINSIHNNNESIITANILEDNTCIELNGQISVFNKNESFSFYTNKTELIRSSKKITMHRYFESNGCMNNQMGDPELFQIRPISSLTKESIFYTPNGFFQKYYLNIIIPNESLDSIYLDEKKIDENFTMFNEFYSIAEIEINAGKHIMSSSNGFSAFVYGVSNSMAGPNSAGYYISGLGFNMDYKFKLNSSYKKTILCENETALYNSIDSTSQFLWNDGSTSMNRVFNDSGLYIVEIRNNCLNYIYYDTLDIKKINCLCTPNVPQAFSPNGDGINDELQIEYSCVNSQTFQLKIYNRWGNLIYENKNGEKFWDGKNFNQNISDDGTYVYIINYIDDALINRTKSGVFSIVK